MIGGDDLPQVLGIEPRRQGGRADKVAEHHGELATLGGVCRLRHRGGARCRVGLNTLRRDSRRSVELLDRGDDFASMANARNTHFLQVVDGEFGQHRTVDAIVAEYIFVLPETEDSSQSPTSIVAPKLILDDDGRGEAVRTSPERRPEWRLSGRF